MPPPGRLHRDEAMHDLSHIKMDNLSWNNNHDGEFVGYAPGYKGINRRDLSSNVHELPLRGVSTNSPRVFYDDRKADYDSENNLDAAEGAGSLGEGDPTSNTIGEGGAGG